MSDIKVLIVVDGIFDLTTSYPISGTQAGTAYGPDAWFTVSHVINTLRNSTSPTFTVDTASRGWNAAGNFDASAIVNTVPDPNATISGPFRFDTTDLTVYDEIWLFGFEGLDGSYTLGPLDSTGEYGGISQSELAAITNFMEQGGGLFATGDHDGLGSGMCGRIPRCRYMRLWFSAGDNSTGQPPFAGAMHAPNWAGGSKKRIDTLQKSAQDTDSLFYFDDQSDDIPQVLTLVLPSHPVVQGATGPLTVYPDHMHEGEVMIPTGPQLQQTAATDPTLSFANPGFIEFPTVGTPGYQEVPVLLATSSAGTGGIPGNTGPTAVGHVTQVPDTSHVGPPPFEDRPCENKNFSADTSTCNVYETNSTLAAYDGATVNVGRIVTDSSFHHFLDLNLLGDPCSNPSAKMHGFDSSTSGQAVLREISAFYINMATWLAWPERQFYFVVVKNNYGLDEVKDSATWSGAFYLFLEGRTPNVVGDNPIITFSGSFAPSSGNIPGLVFSKPTISYDIGNTGANANVIQRIRFEYGITFNGPLSEDPFPAPGSTTPAAFTLAATINIQGNNFGSLPAEFFLVGGEDPYFTNVNSTAENQPYLSQDLRVFSITPTADNQTFSGVEFTFQTGNATTLDTGAAYTYIQKLIASLNSRFGYLNSSYAPPDTNVFDPLDTQLPHQNGALNGDSSVTPFTGSNPNYNFAIARVRMKSASSTPASNVKVFFRLFTTQTFDTDFINITSATTSADPNVTYASAGALLDPTSPDPGTDGNGKINGSSLPFFAMGNYDNSPSDYSPNGVNNQTIGGEQYTWAFFGCFLNVNDVTNVYGTSTSPYGSHPVQYWLAGSAHNCLVAQIAYAPTPIENLNGVIEYPGNSDKLAQRNLQVTTSGNPGFPATHRVPQTIDVRPSPPPQSTSGRSILAYPDEMMIDWGRTPVGSVVSIYWPEVTSASVVKLAQQLYPAQTITASDVQTIQVTVSSPVTFIPIPTGTSGSYAGLMTIDLPDGIRVGNEFDVLVRRISTKQVAAQRDPKDRTLQLLWRYVSGSFLARLAVQKESTILPADENLLAILTWRLTLIGPGNRWYPVLLRYISDISARIVGMGGDPSKIPPSPNGYPGPLPHPSPGPGHGHGGHSHTGKVIRIRYDRFGDFEGFTLLSENGKEHKFRGHGHKVEELIRRAWAEGSVITVFFEPHHPEWPASIVLERPH